MYYDRVLPSMTGEVILPGMEDRKIRIEENSVSSGATLICYRVQVQKNGETAETPYIMKEFFPNIHGNESYATRDPNTQLLKYSIYGSATQESFMLEFKARKKAALRAYEIQKKLAAEDTTMGIVVRPDEPWESDDGTQFITFHEANWGDSLDRNPPENWKEITQIIYMLADAIDRIHKQGYLYIDLKEDNILWLDRGCASGMIKLFDFDSAVCYAGSEQQYPDHPRAGKAIAPELRRVTEKNDYGSKRMAYRPAADVYAIGAVWFRLMLNNYHVTPQDEEAGIAKEAPFYQRLSERFRQDDMRGKLTAEQQEHLAEMMLRCILRKKVPEQPGENTRYLTAGELSQDLKEFLDGVGIRQLPEDIVSKTSYSMLAAGVLDKNPLYRYAEQKADGGVLSALIVGDSPMRDAFFENIFAACQMLNHDLHIHFLAYDVEDYAKELLERCPELGKTAEIFLNDEQWRNPDYDKEDVSVVESKLAKLYFTDAEQLSGEYAYGRELSADIVQTYLMRNCEHPVSYVLIVDKDTDSDFDMAQKLWERAVNTNPMFICYMDSRGDGFDLRKMSPSVLQTKSNVTVCPIGSNERFSEEEKAFEEDVVRRALNIHLMYEHDKDPVRGKRNFLQVDSYNKRSSIRSALAVPYYLKSAGIDPEQSGAGKRFQQDILDRMDDRIVRQTYWNLLWLEHRSWIGFMVADGWKKPTWEQVKEYAFRNGCKQQDKSAKLHPCMCPSKANGLRLQKSELSDWNSGGRDGSFDELNQFSLRLHRHCGELIRQYNGAVQQLIQTAELFCENEVQRDAVLGVRDSIKCLHMLFLNNETSEDAGKAWKDAKDTAKKAFKGHTILNHLMDSISEIGEIYFEYNLYHDYKKSDADILAAIPKILE